MASKQQQWNKANIGARMTMTTVTTTDHSWQQQGQGQDPHSIHTNREHAIIELIIYFY